MHTRTHEHIIVEEYGLSVGAVAGIKVLLDSGATVPFIARYRKEQTASSDEEQIRAVRERLAQLRELDKRREAIVSSLRERNVLTDELLAAIEAAGDKAELEDIYLPYRPKRRTRAQKAREAGLEPLAAAVYEIASGMRPVPDAASLSELASEFVASGEPGGQGLGDGGGDWSTVEAALSGARDIIAEWASEDRRLREELRNLFARRAHLRCSIAHDVRREGREAQVYRDYFDYDEPAPRVPSHRILAVLRGQREGVLRVRALPGDEQAVGVVRRRWTTAAAADRHAAAAAGRTGAAGRRGEHGRSEELIRACREELDTALTDSWKRLLAPSLENEYLAELQRKAEAEAAEVFARNLRELLLSAPMGGRRTLAVDPGLRTGCKVVCLDEHGDLLHHETIYPLAPKKEVRKAGERAGVLCDHYRVEVIAVGNGTGGREAQRFLSELGLKSKSNGRAIPVISVNEAGASVYSASRVAKEEFPDHDVTVRGAISIGRRLLDPLAELVKIDPKSVGVGQYQHDIDEKLLDSRLTDTVVSCVNAVGADLNTASAHLLRHVAGLNARSAEAVVTYRRTSGGFRSRAELQKVAGIGPRSYEQAAGFLRVTGGHPLDATAVHPERYALVERMADDLGVEVPELVGNDALCKNINLNAYVDAGVGMPTLEDIVAALSAPGRDPRADWDAVEFRDDVTTIDDLAEGMRLSGKVTNITDFGAFVDVGVHRDGLVHISKLADRFVRDPHEVVSVGTAVTVRVIEVDKERGRIALSMVDEAKGEG